MDIGLQAQPLLWVRHLSFHAPQLPSAGVDGAAAQNSHHRLVCRRPGRIPLCGWRWVCQHSTAFPRLRGQVSAGGALLIWLSDPGGGREFLPSPLIRWGWDPCNTSVLSPLRPP